MTYIVWCQNRRSESVVILTCNMVDREVWEIERSLSMAACSAEISWFFFVRWLFSLLFLLLCLSFFCVKIVSALIQVLIDGFGLWNTELTPSSSSSSFFFFTSITTSREFCRRFNTMISSSQFSMSSVIALVLLLVLRVAADDGAPVSCDAKFDSELASPVRVFFFWFSCKLDSFVGDSSEFSDVVYVTPVLCW